MREKSSNVLTEKIALEGIKHRNCDFTDSEYDTIASGATEALAQYDGPVRLCLKKLDKPTAETLAKNEDTLSILVFDDVTPDVAAALAKNKGGLELLLLENVSPLVTSALSKHRGSLLLLEFSDHPLDSVIQAMAPHEGLLYLTGCLDRVSDETWRHFSKHQGGLNVSGLDSISDATASVFASTTGELGLSIKSLCEPVAKALAKHCGALWLGSLTALSVKNAAILATHQGDLFLDGLKSLSVGAARALAKHRGNLSFESLEKCSAEMFDVFGAHEGKVEVPILTNIEKVAAAYGDDHREFIVGLDFYYSDINYSGFQIMERAQIRELLAALDTNCKIGTPNMPGDWWEEFDIGMLKGCFHIHSPWPSHIQAMRKVFGECVGQTTLFDRVQEAEPVDT